MEVQSERISYSIEKWFTSQLLTAVETDGSRRFLLESSDPETAPSPILVRLLRDTSEASNSSAAMGLYRRS
jgi:HECT-like Ubiquitin-conjugating enzyme (E2)-binding